MTFYGDSSFNFNDPYPTAQEQANGTTNQQADTEAAAKLKRTACTLCRKRKLRCDAARPKCATCDRLGHDCEYNEVRKKSGPKRGYVKALEARLSQVETQLKTADGSAPTDTGSATIPPAFHANLPGRPASDSPHNDFTNNDIPDFTYPAPAMQIPDIDINVPSPQPTSWDMISMGLEEPLPTQGVQKELYEIYFRKIHPTAPMLHKARFYASLNYAPHMRPPVCLRYAMWTLAASASDAYSDMQQHFYRRSRKYMEMDEMRAYGEACISIYHCQTSLLLSIFEFKNMHFPRAWISTGRAVRLSQMLGLHRLDGAGLEVKICCAPPADWTEKEERKRTFWMVFWEDRCASIGTGWPMSVDEQDIMTNLPASEEAFQNSTPEVMPSLDEALGGQVTNISAFAGAIMLTALFGRNLLHLHRPTADERESDLNGPFWKRHRSIDSVLLNITLNLPDHLRIPRGLPDPNVMFMNMCIHTSVICLHQAAIFKVDRNRLPKNLGEESKIRCVTAAAEIANIMRSISHCDLGTLNPFSAFCLYVASRVFVQYLKSRPNDSQILGSLHFLLSAMHALKRKTPLAESFLAQLDVDLEGAGIPTDYESSVDSLKKKGFPNMREHLNTAQAERLRTGRQSGRMHQQDIDMNIGSLPTEELRTTGNRFAPFDASGKPSWKERDANPSLEPTMIGDYRWETNTYTPSGFSKTVTQQSRQGSLDDGSATTGPNSHRSGSSGVNALSPSQSESSGDKDQSPGDLNFYTNNAGGNMGYDDNQPAGFVSFKDYPPANAQVPGSGQNFSLTGQSPMTQQQFDELTRQFMPPTPGGAMDGWSSGISGLTPAPSGEDWTQMLNNMDTFDDQSNGWPNNQQL